MTQKETIKEMTKAWDTQVDINNSIHRQLVKLTDFYTDLKRYLLMLTVCTFGLAFVLVFHLITSYV